MLVSVRNSLAVVASDSVGGICASTLLVLVPSECAYSVSDFASMRVDVRVVSVVNSLRCGPGFSRRGCSNREFTV